MNNGYKKKSYMKRLLSLFMVMLLSVAPMHFSASADATGLVVDVQMNADGSFTDSVGGQSTTFNWTNNSGVKPTYGSFSNKKGSVTTYLQFGKDPDGDGTYEPETSGNQNWLEIGNANMNGKTATTLSFWLHVDDVWGGSGIGHLLAAYTSEKDNYTNSTVNEEYKLWTYSGNGIALKSASSSSVNSGNKYVSNSSWKNQWSHIVITRVYDASLNSGAGGWTTTLYRNGSKATAASVSGALPNDTGFIYALGGRPAAKYSGIKLYNVEKDAAALYAEEKDLYEERVVVEMEMLEPISGGSLTNTSGKLVLKFNCPVEESSLSGVTLKKVDSDVNCLNGYSLSDSGKTVIFLYSGLEEGESYVLSISGVESDDGSVLEDVSLNYTVLQNTTLVVDAQINEDGTVTNKIEGQDANFSWSSSTANKASYGSFVSESGDVTSYLQFGKDSDGDGSYEMHSSASDGNYLKIGSPNMNNQATTTLSFWVNMEDMWGAYAAFVLYGKNLDSYSNQDVAKGNAQYLIWDYATNGMRLVSGTADNNVSGNFGNNGATNSWKNLWSHLVITKEYNEEEEEWTVTLYRNGSKVTSTTVEGELADETDYVYAIGGKSAAKYSGIKLYNILVDASAIYEAEKELYKVLPQSMIFEKAAPTGELSSSGGEITISFNNYVDKNTISGIGLVDEDGNPSGGKTLVYLPEEKSKIVMLRYGALDGGNTYKLQIPAGVRSLNGFSTEAPETIEYSCAGNVIYYEDFEDLEDGAVAQDGIEGLRAMSAYVNNSWTDFLVHTDEETGRKYIDFVASERYKEDGTKGDSVSYLSYTLPDSVDDGEVVYEMKFRTSMRGDGAAGSSLVELMRPYTGKDDTGDKTTLISVSGGSASLSGANNYEGGFSFSTVADSEGWHTLKMATGMGTDGKRYFDFYYDASNPSAFCRVIRNDFNKSKIRSVRLVQIFVGAAQTGFGTAAVSVDEVKVYKRTIPTVIGSDADEIKNSINTIYFGAEMDEESLAEAEIYYLSDKNEKIEASFISYDEAERAATVRLNNYFLYGRSYDLYIKGAKSAEYVLMSEGAVYSFDVAPYDVSSTTPVFKNGVTGEVVTDLSQAETIKVSLTLSNSKSTDANASVILLHTDIAGCIKNAKCEPITVPEGDLIPVNVLVSEKTFENGDSIKLLIWDNTSGGTKPVLLDPVSLNYEEVE